MTQKIYVGGLPYTATEAEVRELFAQHGEVLSVTWITDRDSGQFRGFCFIEMDNEAASKAMQSLNGHDFNGHTMKVDKAKPRR